MTKSSTGAATKVDSTKTKSKAPASAGATNLTGPYDPFASNDPFAESTTVKTVVPVKTDKIHIRESPRAKRVVEKLEAGMRADGVARIQWQ